MNTATETDLAQTGVVPLGEVADLSEKIDPKVFDRVSDPGILDFVAKMGDAIHASRMFGTANAAQGRVIAFHCLVHRISHLDFFRTWQFVSGKISMKPEAMLAKFQEIGGKVKWTDMGDKGSGEAKAKFTAPDNSGTYEISYTMENAKLAGLVKAGSGWTKNPDAMLRARLISKALRIVCPAVVAGVYTPEEVADFVDDIPQDAPQSAPSHASDPTTTAASEAAADNEPPFDTADKASPAETAQAAAAKSEGAPQQSWPTPHEAAAAPASQPAASANGAASNGKVSDATLTRVAELKNELQIPVDNWKSLLRNKLGVESARDLTEVQADQLIAKLTEKLNQVRDKKALGQWADTAVANGSGKHAEPVGAAAGN